VTGTTVCVLKKNIYNDENHKSLGWCNKGDIITVASGGYAEALMNDGLVTDDLDFFRRKEPVPEVHDEAADDEAEGPTVDPEAYTEVEEEESRPVVRGRKPSRVKGSK
jgi:hypothetical protein